MKATGSIAPTETTRNAERTRAGIERKAKLKPAREALRRDAARVDVPCPLHTRATRLDRVDVFASLLQALSSLMVISTSASEDQAKVDRAVVIAKTRLARIARIEQFHLSKKGREVAA
jgi:hypothetical protein